MPRLVWGRNASTLEMDKSTKQCNIQSAKIILTIYNPKLWYRIDASALEIRSLTIAEWKMKHCVPQAHFSPLTPKAPSTLDFIPFMVSSFIFSSSCAISFSHLSPFSRISFSRISYWRWPLSRTWS